MSSARVVIIGGPESLNALADSAVSVITNESSMDLIWLRRHAPQLMSSAPDAIFIVATRPVEAITYAVLKLTGLLRQRVMGVGTVADSCLFRDAIAKRLKVHPDDVSAFMAGEQGPGAIPLWSSASIAGIPLHEWAVMHHGKLSVLDRTDITQSVRGQSSSQFVQIEPVRLVVDSVLRDENRALAVSSLVQNYRGIDESCLSLPCIVNASGVEAPLPIPMNANEEAGLRNSAENVRSAVQKLGF